jgi:hypothetical protein
VQALIVTEQMMIVDQQAHLLNYVMDRTTWIISVMITASLLSIDSPFRLIRDLSYMHRTEDCY